MTESWNDIFGGQFSRDYKLYKCDTFIPEHTPILFEDKVVGHTVGENKAGCPVKCVLYSQFLNKEEMLDHNDSYKTVSLQIVKELNHAISGTQRL